jgi:hypothetical protein
LELRKFESGAVRDAEADSTRYDLIAPEGMRRLAETYAEGAKKYDDHNWRKGMPVSATANHAIKHIFKYLAGWTDEDHLAHAAWGLFALMEFEKTHPELDDRYFKPTAVIARAANALKENELKKTECAYCGDVDCTYVPQPSIYQSKEVLTVD